MIKSLPRWDRNVIVLLLAGNVKNWMPSVRLCTVPSDVITDIRDVLFSSLPLSGFTLSSISDDGQFISTLLLADPAKDQRV